MNPSDVPVAELLPHAGNMVLLDQLLEAGDNSATARVRVSNNGLFCGDQGSVPAWVGIEYMAQTIGAWAGWQARLQQQPVKIGFLLGTRRYSSNVSRFRCGDELRVTIERNFGEETGMGSFQCTITGQNILIESSLNVFQPSEAQIRELMEAR